MKNPDRAVVDPRIDSPDREGLTGTTGATVYSPLESDAQVTIAPDGRPMDEQPAWRTDFPIDWPEDHYVERREFMKFMVLISLAFSVGHAWIAVQNWFRRWRSKPELLRVASASDVGIGSVATFAYPTSQDPCLLIGLDERTVVAYSQRCTHLSCAVVPSVSEGVIRCPCHDGYFDLASGRPIAGPPRRPLSRVRLERRGDQIFAAGIEDRTV